MSETLCTLRTKGGGGGKYTETSLWTNSAPTSNFNAQTVTLSDSLSNYKYVAIDYCYNTSNTGITSRVIYDVTDFKKAVKDNSTNHTISGLTIEGANNVNYARPVFYISDTSIAFGLSSTLNGSGTYAQGTIPLEILGLNELAHGTMITSNADILPFKAIPASQPVSFTTKGEPKAVWMVFKAQASGTDALVLTNVNPTTNEIDNNTIYRARTASLGTFDINTGRAFTITNNSVSTSFISTSAYYACCIYTY